MLEVCNLFKDRFYNQRSTIVQEKPIANPSPDRTDTTEIQPATINTENPMDKATDPLEKAHMPTKQITRTNQHTITHMASWDDSYSWRQYARWHRGI